MYEKFQQLDGSHPWRDVSPNGYIDYPVRYREGGRVLYFNYLLAKELGLIPQHHRHRLTPKLEQTILTTFSIQIINEHDQNKGVQLPSPGMESKLYMATRYLQSQHKNKQGKTSGDGRSIWNGFIRTERMIFDITSRGTGATILSPGVQEAGRPLATGDESVGYSSGLADLEEMLGSAIMSEIFYRKGIPSERCLAVIDYKDKTAIGVRTAPNLIRPAHIFRYLKLDNYEDLKKSFDYFIQRQEENRTFELPQKGQIRYYKTLEHLAKVYAKLAAVVEEEYIFNWLAWDGDNMLASGALLDYGSIRQFAAKHNKYRYEDVDRFSTCLSEQRYWARWQMQTFAQVVDYVLSGQKKNITDFASDPILEIFDQRFEYERQKRMLYRIGFTIEQSEKLIGQHQDQVDAFRKVINYFEEVKTVKGTQRVPDGIDHPPVFLVRHVLRELPKYLLKNRKRKEWTVMPAEKFCKIMAASYIDRRDLVLTPYREQRALQFQKLYQQLIDAAGTKPWLMLKDVAKRAAVINYEHRGTGDGFTWICKESNIPDSSKHRDEFQQAVERFIDSQVLVPGKWKPIRPWELRGNTIRAQHLRRMQETLELYNEAI